MRRRKFLSSAIQRAAQAGLNEAAERANQRAARWVRPPFALGEVDFLLACTRCGKCSESCPHDVVFPLSMELGADVAGTPALDLGNKGCHLCSDWPCVTVCEDHAFNKPPDRTDEVAIVPRLARVVLDTTQCLPYNGPECGACAPACPVDGAMLWNGDKPSIDPDVCNGCGLCREACIVDPKAVSVYSLHRAQVTDSKPK